MRRSGILIVSFILLSAFIRAQHYQFSQFYAAQTYLNPAFTGANACSRLSLNYRAQWISVPGTFTTYQMTFDHFVRKYNSGIGIQFYSDKAGSGSLKTTQVALLYAYELKINKKYGARAGLSFGSVTRTIDYSALTFGDQIARGGAATSVEDRSILRNGYFDAAFGALFYSAQYWGGFSINHLTRPNQSLTGGESQLPMEFKLHGGYKFLFDGDESTTSKKNPEKNSITITANYKKQQKFNQVDLGLYYSKNVMVVGMWYRGIPLRKPYSWYQNNDAIVFLVGVSSEKFNVGYSYDITVSKLTHTSSGGSHELSMSYQFCNPKKKKKKRTILISCPKF